MRANPAEGNKKIMHLEGGQEASDPPGTRADVQLSFLDVLFVCFLVLCQVPFLKNKIVFGFIELSYFYLIFIELSSNVLNILKCHLIPLCSSLNSLKVGF
jgi:hypothetical protein